jgi:hypothetical protein
MPKLAFRFIAILLTLSLVIDPLGAAVVHPSKRVQPEYFSTQALSSLDSWFPHRLNRKSTVEAIHAISQFMTPLGRFIFTGTATVALGAAQTSGTARNFASPSWGGLVLPVTLLLAGGAFSRYLSRRRSRQKKFPKSYFEAKVADEEFMNPLTLARRAARLGQGSYAERRQAMDIFGMMIHRHRDHDLTPAVNLIEKTLRENLLYPESTEVNEAAATTLYEFMDRKFQLSHRFEMMEAVRYSLKKQSQLDFSRSGEFVMRSVAVAFPLLEFCKFQNLTLPEEEVLLEILNTAIEKRYKPIQSQLLNASVQLLQRMAAEERPLPQVALELRDQIIGLYLRDEGNDVYHFLTALRDLPVQPAVMNPQLLAAITQLQSAANLREGYIPYRVGSMQTTSIGYLEKFDHSPDSFKKQNLQPIRIVRDETGDMIHPGFVGATLQGPEGNLRREFGDLWVLKNPDLSQAKRVMIRPDGVRALNVTPEADWYWIPLGIEKSGSRAIYIHEMTGLVVSVCVDTFRTQQERAEYIAEGLTAEFQTIEEEAAKTRSRRPRSGVVDPLTIIPGQAGVLHLRDKIGQLNPMLRIFVLRELEKKLQPKLSLDLEQQLNAPYEELSDLGYIDVAVLKDQLIHWMNEEITRLPPEKAVELFFHAQSDETTPSGLPFVITEEGYALIGRWLKLNETDPESVLAYLCALSNAEVQREFVNLPLVNMLLARLKKGVYSHEELPISHYWALQQIGAKLRVITSPSQVKKLSEPDAMRALEEHRAALNIEWRRIRREEHWHHVLRGRLHFWDEMVEYSFILLSRLKSLKQKMDTEKMHGYSPTRRHILVGGILGALVGIGAFFLGIYLDISSIFIFYVHHYFAGSQPSLGIYLEPFSILASILMLTVVALGYLSSALRRRDSIDISFQFSMSVIVMTVAAGILKTAYLPLANLGPFVPWPRIPIPWSTLTLLWCSSNPWAANFSAWISFIALSYLTYTLFRGLFAWGMRLIGSNARPRQSLLRLALRSTLLVGIIVGLFQTTTLARYHDAQKSVSTALPGQRMALARRIVQTLSHDELTQIAAGTYRYDTATAGLYKADATFYTILLKWSSDAPKYQNFQLEPTTEKAVRAAALLELLPFEEASRILYEELIHRLQQDRLERVRKGRLDPSEELEKALKYLPWRDWLYLRDDLNTSFRTNPSQTELDILLPAFKAAHQDWRVVLNTLIERERNKEHNEPPPNNPQIIIGSLRMETAS